MSTRDNHVTYLDEGEEEIPITVTVKDAGGNLVNLAGGWTVQFEVWLKGSSVLVIDEAMEVNPDQVNYKGQATYITVLADSMHTPSANYRWRYVARHPDGRVFHGPKTEGQNYGTFILRSKR